MAGTKNDTSGKHVAAAHEGVPSDSDATPWLSLAIAAGALLLFLFSGNDVATEHADSERGAKIPAAGETPPALDGSQGAEAESDEAEADDADELSPDTLEALLKAAEAEAEEVTPPQDAPARSDTPAPERTKPSSDESKPIRPEAVAKERAEAAKPNNEAKKPLTEVKKPEVDTDAASKPAPAEPAPAPAPPAPAQPAPRTPADAAPGDNPY
jgi:outer membrane biosynthesis protein TonB